MVNHILESRKKCFKLAPGKICFPKRKPWWNAECASAVALIRRAFNKWRSHPVRTYQLEYRRLEARARRVIKRAKKLSWRKFLNNLNMHTKCSEVWHFFISFMGIGQPNCYPITINGNILIDAMAKAELFATHFKDIR